MCGDLLKSLLTFQSHLFRFQGSETTQKNNCLLWVSFFNKKVSSKKNGTNLTKTGLREKIDEGRHFLDFLFPFESFLWLFLLPASLPQIGSFALSAANFWNQKFLILKPQASSEFDAKPNSKPYLGTETFWELFCTASKSIRLIPRIWSYVCKLHHNVMLRPTLSFLIGLRLPYYFISEWKCTNSSIAWIYPENVF